MFHALNHGWLIGLTIAGLSAVAGPRGYLPQAGPPPLRFRAAAPMADKAELPPLPADVPPVTPEEPTTGDPKSLESEPETTTQEQTLPEPPVAATPSEPSADPEPNSIPSTPAPALSPQLLIPFFTSDSEQRPNKATTPTRTAVVAPVSFVPPPPSQKSVSRATYSQGK